ncbi:MAG: STAS domain-containing protein [Clostridia bacterium]|nr:STAS domain-containing protein [Clostridia bacterium]
MEIKKTQDGSELTLAVTGRLDTNTSKFLEAELKKSIGGITLLSFDFSELEYLSSAGLRVLVNAQKVMNRQGSMVIRSANQNVMDVFIITGLIDVFTVET